MLVKLQNPLPGGATHVGEKRAKRLIKRGVAKLVDGLLVFIETHHARKSATESHFDIYIRGYDNAVRARVLTQREAKAIPFAGNIRRMGLSA